MRNPNRSVPAHVGIIIALLAAAGLSAKAQDGSGWEDGSALPADALKKSVDLETSVNDLVTSGSSLTTGLKSLIGNFKGLRIEENDLEFRVIFESDILFDFDKAVIRPDAETALSAVASALEEFKGKKIRIIGHTDSKGADAYNNKLSARRAESVKKWLSLKPNLNGFILVSEGKGEWEPIVPNQLPSGEDDPQGRQKNRRVEIRIPK